MYIYYSCSACMRACMFVYRKQISPRQQLERSGKSLFKSVLLEQLEYFFKLLACNTGNSVLISQVIDS